MQIKYDGINVLYEVPVAICPNSSATVTAKFSPIKVSVCHAPFWPTAAHSTNMAGRQLKYTQLNNKLNYALHMLLVLCAGVE